MQDLKRLRSVVEQNYTKGRIFRENQHQSWRQDVGRNYSEDGTGDKVLVNHIHQARTIFARLLSQRMPRALVTSDSDDLRVTAARASRLANAKIKELNLGETLTEWVEAALMGIGIVKVGWYEVDTVEYEGEQVPVGEVYAENILYEDWVQDMRAKGKPWKHCSFMGHKYRVTLEEAKANEDWDKDAREALVETQDDNYNEGGDPKITVIGAGEQLQQELLKKEVEIWEIFLVDENLIVTFAAEGTGDSSDPEKPLMEEEWDGPSRGPYFVGPYHFLGYDWIMGNSMPNAPVNHWRDLHELDNQLMNKNSRKGLAQKNVYGYRPGSEGDAELVRSAADGDMVQMNDPESVKMFETATVDQTLLAYSQILQTQMNKATGNTEALGGLGPQSETASQDEQSLQQANAQVEDMKDVTFIATSSLIQSVLYYWWNDPIQDFDDVIKVTDELLWPYTITAEERGNIWHQLNFDVVPYSMEHMAPPQRVNFLLQLVQDPMFMQHLQMNGLTWDIEYILQLMADYRNLPELREAIINQEGQPLQGPQPTGSSMPATTKRQYERVSRSQATPQGQSQMLQQLLLSGNGQQPQMGGPGNGL